MEESLLSEDCANSKAAEDEVSENDECVDAYVYLKDCQLCDIVIQNERGRAIYEIMRERRRCCEDGGPREKGDDYHSLYKYRCVGVYKGQL